MRISLTIALLTLAACAPSISAPVTNPDRYVASDAPVPFAVRQLLPRGVFDADVRLWQNCYGYVYQGQTYPVLTPRGSQYCL